MEAVDIVGAGAIGVTVGYALLSGGISVRFVENNPLKVTAGNRHGVRLGQGPPHSADFLLFEDWQPQPDRWVILCTKCYDNATVLQRLNPHIPLLPIQNGIDPLLESFPHDHAGIAAFVAEAQSDEPTARITRPGPLYLGARRPKQPATAERESTATTQRLVARELVMALRRSRLVPVRWVKDIRPIQATKLWYNAAIAPLATLAGTDNAALLEQPLLRQLFLALLEENYRILRAAGVPLGWLGPFPPGVVARLLGQQTLLNWLSRWFARTLRGTYCSMKGEMSRGRTELEYFTGQLLRLAQQVGVAAPLNRAIYDHMQRWTAQRLPPDPRLLEQFLPYAS